MEVLKENMATKKITVTEHQGVKNPMRKKLKKTKIVKMTVAPEKKSVGQRKSKKKRAISTGSPAGSFVSNMMMPRKPFSMPRFIPTTHASVYYTATLPINLQSDEKRVYLFRPEIESCLKTLVYENNGGIIFEPQHQNDYHNYNSTSELICYDADLIFDNGVTITSSFVNPIQAADYVYFKSGLHKGAKGYLGNYSAATRITMSALSTDHAATQTWVLGLVSLRDGIVATSPFNTSYNGSTNVNVLTAGIDLTEGFIIYLQNTNPGTLGHIPSFKWGMQGYNAGNGTTLTLNGGYSTKTDSMIRLLPSSSQNSVQAQFDNASSYCVTAMDVLLKSTTASVWNGGNVAIGNFPAESYQGIPLDYNTLFSHITSLRFNKYHGNLKDGAHWFYVPQSLDNLQYKAIGLAPVQNTTENRTPFSVLTIQAPTAASSITLQLEINMCLEYLTNDLSLKLERGIPTFSFTEVWIGWINAHNNCGENPSHLSRIGNYVKDFIQSPEFKTVLKTAGPLVLKALTMI